MLTGAERTFEGACIDMTENSMTSKFLLEAFAAAQKQNLFPFGNESRLGIISPPFYFENKEFTETCSTANNSEPLTIDSIIEINKKFASIKPIKIFANANLVIRKRILEKYPKTKKKRIIKKWMKKYGRTIEIPMPDFLKVETKTEMTYTAHPETIKKTFADLQPILREHQRHAITIPFCEVFGVQF